MKLIIGEQHTAFTELPTAEELIEKINESLADGFHFSHFIADGEEVYDEHEEYLEEHLPSIEQLEVIIKSEKEFMKDVLLSMQAFLEGVIPEVSALAKEYQSVPTSGTRERFDRMLGGAEWLTDMLNIVSNSKEQPSNWKTFKDFAGSLHSELSKLGKAVEKRKNNEISKVIRQGIVPVFERIVSEIDKSIDAKGTTGNL